MEGVQCHAEEVSVHSRCIRVARVLTAAVDIMIIHNYKTTSYYCLISSYLCQAFCYVR